LWISGYEDRILYDTRQGRENNKYQGLIEILMNALGEENYTQILKKAA
jgi:hypothetical protein